MTTRMRAGIQIALPLLGAFFGCHSENVVGGAVDAAPPVRDAVASSHPDELHVKPTTELDVSTGGIPRHFVLGGLQIARIDPKDPWFKFTLSQTNDDPLDASTRVTFSVQTHSVQVGKPLLADGHLLDDGAIYTSTKPCVVTLSSEGPPEGPDHLHWVEGTFSCEEVKTPGKDGALASVSNGHFTGRFVDTGAP